MPISVTSKPSDKLDFIFSHICNFKFLDGRARNSEGGTIVDFSNCYMDFEYNYFGLSSYEEMVFFLETLSDNGYIQLNKYSITSRSYSNGSVNYCQHGKITFKGLNHLNEIENKGILSNKCFVAMPFDENKIKRLNAIKNACTRFQFEAFIVEEFHEKGNQTIDAKIISAIKGSNFCIADFTGINPGAYMEAGFAMGRDMKVIFICEKADFGINNKHFDVNHYPFLIYTDYEDLTNQLVDQIGAYIK